MKDIFKFKEPVGTMPRFHGGKTVKLNLSESMVSEIETYNLKLERCKQKYADNINKEYERQIFDWLKTDCSYIVTREPIFEFVDGDICEIKVVTAPTNEPDFASHFHSICLDDIRNKLKSAGIEYMNMSYEEFVTAINQRIDNEMSEVMKLDEGK